MHDLAQVRPNPEHRRPTVKLVQYGPDRWAAYRDGRWEGGMVVQVNERQFVAYAADGSLFGSWRSKTLAARNLCGAS